MSLGAEVDAEIDLGPLVFEVMGGLRTSLETLNKHLRNIAKLEQAYEFGAQQVPLRTSSVSGTSGSLVFDLGGPTRGRLWELKRLVVGGAEWTSTVNGTMLIVVSPSAGQLTPALPDIVDQANSLPIVATYGTRQVVVKHPNHLFAIVLTPSASTTYAVGGEATDFPDKLLPISLED